MDRVTTTLEQDGYLVTGTLLDEVAIDLASSSEFDALLIGGGIAQSDRLKLKGDVLRLQPSIKVADARGPESVVTVLRQAFYS